MDESEIDAWYDEEKEKAMKEHVKKLEEKKDRDNSLKEYREKMKEVRLIYDKMYEKYVKRTRLKNKLHEKIENIKIIIINKLPWIERWIEKQ